MDDNFAAEEFGNSPHRGGSRNILQIFWQRRGLLLFGLVIGITLGLLNYSQRTPIYRSTAQVLIVKQQGAASISSTGNDPRVTVMDDYVATHLIAIRSQIVIEMAVKDFKLANLRSMQGRDPVGTISAGLRAERESGKDAPSGGGGNNVVNLSYFGSNPNDAQDILVAIVKSYQVFLDQTYEHSTARILKIIEERARDYNDRLDKLRKDYLEWIKKDGAPPVIQTADNGVPLHESLVAAYQKQEIELREQEESLKVRLARVQDAVDKKEPVEVILALGERRYDKGTINQQAQSKRELAIALEQQLFKLDQELKDKNLLHGSEHPETKRIRALIENTRSYYKRIEDLSRDGDFGPVTHDPVQAMLLTLKGELEQAKTNHKIVSERLHEANEEARKYSKWYIEDRDRRDERQRVTELLNGTLKMLASISSGNDARGGFEARSLAEPSPGYKTAPVFWQFLFMGAMIGLLLAAGGAYALDVADKSFRSPDEIRKRLGLSIIGHVPFMPSSTAVAVKTQDGAGNTLELDPGLVALHNPMSPVAEGFRGIRTAMYFSTQSQRHKVIQVTSPNMGDGKTTLITNLAISIAQSGRKVLLVDADLRRPRVHRAFGLTSKIGLAEVIAGVAELDEAIQITVVPNLSILPCGRRPQNPAELLTLPKIEDIIDDLRDAFDYVLIDTPPLLAVSDPCIVAPRVDGLILTVRIAKNGRPAAERAADLLAGVKVNCLGVVVNGVGKHGSMSGYGYEHYRYTDEYNSNYTSSEDQPGEAAHDKPVEDAAQADARQADARNEEKQRSTGHDEPSVTHSEAFIPPSVNGHATHALPKE